MPGISAPPSLFPSKRDLWIELVLWAANVALLVTAAQMWGSPGPLAVRLGSGALILAITLLVLWVLYGTSYQLDDRELVARSGPLRWRVPLAAIESVTPTRNPLSAPACSLDRLHVRFAGRKLGLLISPADKEGFLRELRLRCPLLVEQDGGLVRKEG